MDAEAVIFLAVLTAAMVAGSYFTGLLCRLSRVHWYWAVVGTAGAGLLIGAFVWLGLSVGHGDLGKGVKPTEVALSALVVGCGSALIPAVMTVLYYRYYRPRSSHPDNVV
jgi:hypothetical protein